MKESSLKLEKLVIKVALMPAMREERRAKEYRWGYFEKMKEN